MHWRLLSHVGYSALARRDYYIEDLACILPGKCESALVLVFLDIPLAPEKKIIYSLPSPTVPQLALSIVKWSGALQYDEQDTKGEMPKFDIAMDTRPFGLFDVSIMTWPWRCFYSDDPSDSGCYTLQAHVRRRHCSILRDFALFCASGE